MKKCAVQLDFLRKVCATIGISKETYTTNRLWDVGPRRGRKKTYNPNAAGRGIRRKTRPARQSRENIQSKRGRPENPEKNIQSKPSGPKIRKSERKPTIQPVLLGWLVVALLLVVDNPRKGHLWGNDMFLRDSQNSQYSPRLSFLWMCDDKASLSNASPAEVCSCCRI